MGVVCKLLLLRLEMDAPISLPETLMVLLHASRVCRFTHEFCILCPMVCPKMSNLYSNVLLLNLDFVSVLIETRLFTFQHFIHLF